jgi:hypothetical protein
VRLGPRVRIPFRRLARASLYLYIFHLSSRPADFFWGRRLGLWGSCPQEEEEISTICRRTPCVQQRHQGPQLC